jgi:hypothetical protein
MATTEGSLRTIPLFLTYISRPEIQRYILGKKAEKPVEHTLLPLYLETSKAQSSSIIIIPKSNLDYNSP